MISELAQDLLTKVQGIPALANASGLDLLGDKPDPGGSKIVPPAVWVVLATGNNTQDQNSNLPSTKFTGQHTFVLGLYLPTSNQIAVQFPLLEGVVKAIQGTISPSGQRWWCHGYKRAANNPGVLIYEVICSITATF